MLGWSRGGEGLWRDYTKGPLRIARAEADEVSYAWDRLIEKFNYHTLGGTSYGPAANSTVGEREEAVRLMAAEGRTPRRVLSKSLLDFLRASRPDQRSTRVMLPVRPGGPHYVFLALPQLRTWGDDDYRDLRRHLLEGLCLVTKLRFPAAADIVGLATEPGLHGERSEDVVYFDASVWGEREQRLAEELQRDLGLLTQCGPMAHSTEWQFPVTPVPQPRQLRRSPSQSLRNSQCPCGSGQKWKRCCGRR
jgi:hypothetical protein